MQVSLPPNLERIVREKVESGLYTDESDVVREALRLLVERESGIDWLREQARQGFDQLDAGEYEELDREQFLQRAKKRDRVAAK
jgi:antitoxin ParD1/3/4